MKIISNVLEDINGIQIYYIIGLIIFVVLFIYITVKTMRRPNKEMERIKEDAIRDDEIIEEKDSNSKIFKN